MLYKNIEPVFEKTAQITKLSENVDNWVSEITNEAYDQLPFLSGKEIDVHLQKVNEENKSGLGVVKVAEGKNSAVFPLIIKKGDMYPLDMMIIDGQVIPATKMEADRYFFEPSMFRGMSKLTAEDMDRALSSSVFPFDLTNKLDYSNQSVKTASVNTEKDYKYNFSRIEATPFRKKYLSGFFEGYSHKELEKTAEKKIDIPKNVDAFLLYSSPSGPKGLALQKDPFGIFKYGGKDMEKLASDEDLSSPVMVGNGEGIKVYSPSTLKSGTINIPSIGEGLFFNTVVDLEGNDTGSVLFLNNQFHALQEKVAGEQVNDKIENDEEPSGKGVFYFNSEDGYKATFPMFIDGKQEDKLIGQDVLGRHIKLGFSKIIKGPIKVEDDLYMLPQDSKFIKLDTEEDNVPESADMLKNAEQQVTIEFSDGFNFRGVPLGEVEVKDAPKRMAELILLGLGSGSGQIDSITKTAELFGSVDFYTDQKFEIKKEDNSIEKIWEKFVKIAEKASPSDDYLDAVAMVAKHLDDFKNVDLIKLGERPDELVDKLLSLNFVSPENITMFVEQLPELKKTASTLAAMTLASRLGISSIPEKATTVCIKNLNEVIKSLDMLKVQ